MITINVIKVNEVEYLAGKIGKEGYSVEFSSDLRDVLVAYAKRYNSSTTVAEAGKVLEDALIAVQTVKAGSNNALTEILKDDLSYNPKTNSYHIISEGKTSVAPVHQFFCDKMIEASEKGLSPKPWLVFWVRLMRNSLYSKDKNKVQTLVNYLRAQYLDEEAAAKLVEEGYSSKIANQLSTFDQISITEEGILAAFKYVKLIDKKFVVEKDANGEQVIKQVAMYERKLEVDPITGEITKDELELPSHAEDFTFEPPLQGQNYDAFTCKDVNDISDAPVMAHVIKIGKIHELAKGFSQVNTNDSQSCVKGLHLGGHYYVKSYNGISSYLVDCLVAPEDIGAVCDVHRGDDGAIRCRRYMVTGGHFAVSKGMYHPSSYAKLLDEEWIDIKAKVIANLNAEKAALEAEL
jgi:hypothetical protein